MPNIPLVASAAALCAAAVAAGDLVAIGSFDPAGAGGLCGAGYSAGSELVWTHECGGSTILGFTNGGAPAGSLPSFGERADDVDVEVAPVDLTLAGVHVPAGSVLFINGESGVAEIYAIDPGTGDLIATLTTEFGNSHVVGGAYHPARQSFFLVQDRVPAGDLANRVAEIDAQTGAVLGAFRPIDSGFDVNYGDLDVAEATGNLYIVSSIESTIGEFTPGGVLVQEHALPACAASLSGIGIDDGSGEAWVSTTTGRIWRLGGLLGDFCQADMDGNGSLDVNDFFLFLDLFAAGDGRADIACNGAIDVNDFFAFLDLFAAGCG